MEKRILILGGGFAGIEAAIKMRSHGYDTTLVSDRDYLFIYPISIWIPVNKRKFDDVSIPLKTLSKKHKFNLIIDSVKKINPRENLVELEKQNLVYDYLIIAMGMSKIPLRGIEHTMSICGKPMESIKIKKKLQDLIVNGNGKIAIGFGGNQKDNSAVRGGPAFELLFNISTYLKKQNIRDNFEITFFAPMKEPGKKMGEKAYNKMVSFFNRYGIKSKTGVSIQRFEQNKVQFNDGSEIESDLIIYISGGNGHEIIAKSDLPLNDSGFIIIDDHCKVEDIDNIYAVGDISALQGPKWASKQGHVAEVMADIAAYNIHNEITNNNSRKGYKEHLNIICIMDTGDGAAFVYRKGNFDTIIPLPIIGHWLKKGWGYYYKYSKMGRIPRIPGM